MIRKAILAAALLLAGCGGGGKPGGAAGLAFRTIAPDVFAVVIDPGSDVAKTEAAIRKQCADKPSCTVVGWSDPAAVAHAYPLTDPQTAALVVRYAKDGLAGTDEMMWDCVRFRAARAPCIPKA
jgi:pimeloyl-ACP methyl ester carboxylesterase